MKLILTVLLSGIICSAANIVGDFPTTATNPNGPWTYGSSPTVGGTFTPFSLGIFTDTPALHGFLGAGDGSVYLPEVTGDSGSVNLDTNFLMMHPFSDGTAPVVRWTAPSAGLWVINGTFRIQDDSPTGVTVYILRDGVTEFSSVLDEPVETANFNIMFTLASGANIDFVVGYNGNYGFDSTGLQGSITSPTPEPGTAGLLLAGLAGAGLFIRRKGQ